MIHPLLELPSHRPKTRLHKIRRKLAVVCGTFILLGLTGEALARVRVKVLSGSWSTRSAFSGQFSEYHPRFGWSLLPGAHVTHRTTEYDVDIVINDQGFRQQVVPPLTSNEGVDRIVVLGDSFTFGYGVQEQVRFTELLPEHLPGVEVLNMGVPATGTDQHVLFFEEAGGADAKPDIVLLVYFLENIERTGTSRYQGYGKPQFLVAEDGTGLQLTNVPVSKPLSAVVVERRHKGLPIPLKKYLRRNSELYTLLRQWFAVSASTALELDASDPYPEYSSDAPSWKVTRLLFKRLAEDAAQVGAQLAVVVVPEPGHLRPHIGSTHQDAVRVALDAINVPMLDLTPFFRKAQVTADEPLYFPVDGHWTEDGHKLVAETIGSWLIEQGLLRSD